MPQQNEKRKRRILVDFLFAAAIAVVGHLVIFSIFSVKETSDSKSSSKLKKVVFLPLEAMPDSPVKKNFLYWLDYGDPTLMSKPSPRHGFSSVYAVSGLRTPEPDVSYVVSAMPVKAGMNSFEEIEVKKDPLSKEISRSWDYRPASIPPPANDLKKRNPPEYPLWKTGDGKNLPQFFSKAADILKKAEGLHPNKRTVLKISFYGKDFFPRVKIMASCGSQDLDIAAQEAFIAKNALLPDDYRKTDEPCYIEIVWQKGQAK
ncbi:MAG: hypothetical protein WAX69_23325 [Victivallales bacterium]